MWCIGKITAEYRERMYALLALYALPYNPLEPVICMDEKSKQLLENTRIPIPPKSGGAKKEDYEYRRKGTSNIFLAVEPKAGQRYLKVTRHRKRSDFAKFIKELSEKYSDAHKIHIALDNLNTHFEKSFYETFSKMEAGNILKRIEFHYTPKHASWLNMAEIEIGILDHQCLDRRLPNEKKLRKEIKCWQAKRNRQKKKINWTFTKQDADKKLSKHYI
ncbi:MAG: IS630 family transposase [bacterium]|nr:IS630 family transposase [bacterium]